MASFLIQSPHTAEDCVKAIQYVHAAGYLTNFYWGCKAGDHTGYAILDAKDKSEAMMVVPTFGRDKARVVELTQFTIEQLQGMHKK
jgi:hypothetical protein